MIIILKSKAHRYTPPSITQALFYMLLIYSLLYFLKSPDLAAASVRASLSTCASGLIPSLFPFMVLVSIINSSGLASYVSGIIGAPISHIFKTDKSTAVAIILGALGGFPIGAVCARSLYERGEISKDSAARLISFTNNASPAFCIAAVGISFFGDVRFGVRLYFCQLAAAATIGILCRKKSAAQSGPPPSPCVKGISEIACTAISEGGITMLKICAFAVFFAVVGDSLCYSIPSNLGPAFSAVCVSFIELALAAKKCAVMGGSMSHILCAFATGFSGLSVHMQTACVLSSSGIPMKRYYISKFFQGILSAIFMAVIYSVWSI